MRRRTKILIPVIVISLLLSAFPVSALEEDTAPVQEPQKQEQQEPQDKDPGVSAGDDEKEVMAQQEENAEPVTVKAPVITGWHRVSPKEMKLSWKTVPDVTDYEIRWSKDKSFKTAGAVKYASAESTATEYTVSGLTANTKYYVSIRAHISQDGNDWYSDWISYSNTKKDFTAKPVRIKKDGSVYEINHESGKKLGKYNILQGACTDGTYIYHVMFNKSNDKCRILKTRLSDNSTVKVSSVLPLDHGNDMTYNPDTGKLIVVHYSTYPRRLSIIDPGTLKVVKKVDVSIPSKLKGASSSKLKAVTGFSAVAYSSQRQQYAVRIIKSHNYILLDKDMKPVKYVTVTKNDDELNQGIDADGDYIYDVQSPRKSSFNTITVYDWDGEYQFKVKVSKKYEMENLYHAGSTYYAGFYHEYYKTYKKTTYTTHYKTYKVKWKKVNGKWKYKTKYKYKKVSYKVKWKKVDGKWKYKTKTKKVRATYKKAHTKTYRKLIRRNYLYKIGRLQ